MIRLIATLLLTACAYCMALSAENANSTAIESVDKPVDFANDVMPLLRRSCVACHHAKLAEGGLVLESFESLMKGGDSGPGVVAKESGNSLLWNRASGTEEPIMPPEDNTVGAKPLVASELELIKRWIDQGAAPSVEKKPLPIQWETPASSLQPAYAVATSGDGRFAAAGRGNQVTVYDQATGAELAKLVDPSLEIKSPATDLDLVQSVAFSPSGELIATGGFRTVKLWRRDGQPLEISTLPVAAATGLVTINRDASKAAYVNALGEIELWDLKTKQPMARLSGLDGAVAALQLTAGGEQLFAATATGQIGLWNAVSGQEQMRHDTKVSIARMAVSGDGKQLATIDGERHVHWYRCEVAETAAASVLAPVDSQVVTAVSDATALLFSPGPTPMLMIGTAAGKVSAIASQSGAMVRTIEQGSPVAALGFNPDGSHLAVASQDGRIQLWIAATGASLITMQSNAAFDYPVKLARREVARLDADVARQTARRTELETFATNEAKAQEKLQAERDQAAEALSAETAKVSTAAALVTTSEESIKKATAEIEASKQNLAAAEKAVAEMTAGVTALKGELEKQTAAVKELEAQKQAATGDALAAVETKLAEATLAVSKTQMDLSKLEGKLTKSQEQVAAAKAAMTAATAKLPPLTAELEKQKTALKDAETKKQMSAVALDQKEKALLAAGQATDRAKSAIPVQAEKVALHTRLAVEGKSRLSQLEQRAASAQSPASAVLLTGQWMVSSHADGAIGVYRVADGMLMNRMAAEPIETVANAPVELLHLGENVVLAARMRGKPSLISAQPVWVLERVIGASDAELISDRVTAIDFRPDGHSFAVGSGEPSRGGEVKLFSTSTGELLKDFGRLHSDTVLGLRFSPDGSLLASSAADRTVRLTDVSKGTNLRTLEGHTHHVLALAWQDEGVVLATAGADQTVKIWDSSDGSQRRTILGFPKEVTSISFLGSDAQFVTTCADGNVRIHNSTNGALVRTMNANGDFLHSLAASLDGQTVLTGGQSGQLRLWSTKDGQLLRELK